MSVTVDWIIERMEEYAPSHMAFDWDNVGLMVGPGDEPVKKILVALDLTDQVLDEAVAAKAQMIVTHHPLINGGLKSVTWKNPVSRRIIKLIQNHISLYSAHTNLDLAEGGTNDVLFDALGLVEKQDLEDETGMGRTGFLPEPITLAEFCGKIKNVLGLHQIRYAGDPERIVKKVGLCSGSGANTSLMRAAAGKDCQVYVTGDVKYHGAQEALDLGLCLIDATHYATEVIIVKKICDYLKEAAGGAVEVMASGVDARGIFEL